MGALLLLTAVLALEAFDIVVARDESPGSESLKSMVGLLIVAVREPECW